MQSLRWKLCCPVAMAAVLIHRGRSQLSRHVTHLLQLEVLRLARPTGIAALV